MDTKRHSRKKKKCKPMRIPALSNNCLATSLPHRLSSDLGRFHPRNEIETELKEYLRSITLRPSSFWDHGHKADVLCHLFRHSKKWVMVKAEDQTKILSRTLDLGLFQLQSALQKDISDASEDEVQFFVDGERAPLHNHGWLSDLHIHHNEMGPKVTLDATLLDYMPSHEFHCQFMTASIPLAHDDGTRAFVEVDHPDGYRYTDLYTTYTYSGSVLGPFRGEGITYTLLWHVYGAGLWLVRSADSTSVPDTPTLNWFISSTNRLKRPRSLHHPPSPVSLPLPWLSK
ncbi:hypothetical protein FRC16_008429 [Serendipita sp. 398]|nr:hypothetical protein FRC16_008429 [Serendipita sp. 398]